MLAKLNELYYHKLKVRFTTSKRVAMHCWLGAVLRNRFLKAADGVFDADGVSLRQLLDTYPLQNDHFMSKRMSGGFPKAFLFRFDDIAPELAGFALYPNRIYSVDLIIIGSFSRYVNLFAQALDRMLSEGFGHPIESLSLVDICEEGENGYLYCRGRQIGELSFPIKINDLEYSSDLLDSKRQLELSLITPMSLISRPGKVDILGYQAKLNNFPSLYQLIRSVCYRLTTLSILYCEATPFADFDEMDDFIENFIAETASAILLDASISWQYCYSSPRKEGATYKMSGYTGQLVFGGVHGRYLPLLHFASMLAVGNDVNYGLGAYNLRYRLE